ncbi:MAG: TIGR00282 family metallophosphoesterase [bacterium]
MNNLKVLFIGDIVGRIGREATVKILLGLKEEYNPDIIITNGENLAHGKGISEKIIKEMMCVGIDVFTSGNHIWQNKDVYPILETQNSPLIRPANYPPMVPGSGIKEVKIGAKSLIIINLMGRVFMKEDLDCPFRAVDKLLKNIDNDNCAGIIVDFHAEATSEKVALKHYLDGRVSAVLGTHTHIQTADEEISKKGTAYISDVGAVVSKDSVIGVDKDAILKSFLLQIKQSHEIPEKGLCEFRAVYLEIDTYSRMATKIERIKREVEV